MAPEPTPPDPVAAADVATTEAMVALACMYESSAIIICCSAFRLPSSAGAAVQRGRLPGERPLADVSMAAVARSKRQGKGMGVERRRLTQT
eukprot:CAMPEP_0204229648 /NCGR_PEP_ID=MMETSP0361-20130328/87370_1 /ASSEMBLY_ACC=CAM_ASM_000343 /TAXON_ID=268821 /ORGANISM="Scrippsiella Hangoei, Strain SHTV-5" /LENGTH=90 /DNA_ID=CAMNT_0051198241 /DNA_START=347 /DNA_END=615 /DNA_ORIENTATION=-